MDLPKEMLKKSILFKFLEKEHEEIDRLKWIESEKSGEDIGYCRAVCIWTRNYRKNWAEDFLKNEA